MTCMMNPERNFLKILPKDGLDTVSFQQRLDIDVQAFLSENLDKATISWMLEKLTEIDERDKKYAIAYISRGLTITDIAHSTGVPKIEILQSIDRAIRAVAQFRIQLNQSLASIAITPPHEPQS